MINILFIEANIDGTIGGSYFSLLFFVQRLDKSKYSPIVLFYNENELIDQFQEAGCKVAIWEKAEPVNFVLRLSRLEKKLNIPVLFPVLKFFGTVLQKIINFLITFFYPSSQCCKYLIREKIDLVHLNNTLRRPHEWISASLFTKAKVVAHERGINNHFSYSDRFWARHLRAIFCISEAVRINLLKHGFLEEKLYLIYNGIDPADFEEVRSDENFLHEIGLEDNDRLFGLVGNIKRWKGQDVAIEAMESVKKKFPGAKCLLIGGHSTSDKGYYDYVLGLVEAKGLEDNIVFTGYRSDVSTIVNALKILIHTSVEPEPFGRVLLEGMALRKPIITPDIGAGPEIVDDNETGLIVKAGDAKELAKAIIYLFDNPAKAQQMGIAGRKRLEENFHIDKNVRKISQVYLKILNI